MEKTLVLKLAIESTGLDFSFVKNEIEKCGHKTVLMNVSVIFDPGIRPNIPLQPKGKHLNIFNTRKKMG
jgi:hypothetical protein